MSYPEREITPMLIVSTAYVTEADLERLGEYGPDDSSIGEGTNCAFIAATRDGYLLWVGSDGLFDGDDVAIEQDIFSKHVVALLKRAHELGCQYVMLDSDGGDCDGLERAQKDEEDEPT